MSSTLDITLSLSAFSLSLSLLSVDGCRWVDPCFCQPYPEGFVLKLARLSFHLGRGFAAGPRCVSVLYHFCGVSEQGAFPFR